MEAYEKRTYLPLVFLILIITGTSTILPIMLQDVLTSDLLVKLVYLSTSLSMLWMAWLIKKNERLYWINGYSYKKVALMDPDKRRELSHIFFNYFGKTMLYIAIYMGVMLFIKTPFLLDFTVFLGGVLLASLWVHIKLRKVSID